MHMKSDDEDDEDYVYNEDLEKSFNRTLEDVSMMDISSKWKDWMYQWLKQPKPFYIE